MGNTDTNAEVLEDITLEEAFALLEEKLENLDGKEACYREILEKKECVSLKDLAISGSDLIASGMEPGKQIGVILNGLLEMVIEEPSYNTKEKLMELKELNF